MKKLLISLTALAVLGTASVANAATLTNGDFSAPGTTGQVGFNTTLTGWSLANPTLGSSYFFVFNPGASPTAVGQYSPVSLYGPIAGSLSGTGGTFIGSDPGFQNSAIMTTLTGLTSGMTYTVSFQYAGAQQVGYDGATQAGWHVSANGQSVDTALLNTPNHGFTGWQNGSFSFVAGPSGSEVLSFLALPNNASAGAPPFALLDSVTINSGVPEPATWAMLIMGFFGLGAVMRSRRNKPATVVA